MSIKRLFRPWGRVLALGLTIALLATALLQPVLSYDPPHDNPGPSTDTIYFKAFHVDIAPASLEKGDMDMYVYSLKTLAAEQLQNSTDIEIYQAPATSLSLFLNPAPSVAGQLNPLSIKEIRFALNYVINRDFIAQEIYKGMAEPMLAHVSHFDYDYRIVNPLVREFNISYQPELAQQIITAEMTAAGAQLVDGYWHYNGNRIDIRFIIRVEDERREIGDLVRAELGKLGFFVIPIYQQFAPAIYAVYGNDPQLFGWHIYTEGWGRGAPERYDYGLINQMYAPWLGNMPGFQESGFWQYENVQLDELGKQIFTGDFNDVDERNDLYLDMTRLGMEEAVRLWVVTVVNSFPAVSGIEGVTEDAASGPKSMLTLREAYIPGQNELTIGNQWVWTERSTWNPIGGFGDIYSNDIWRNMTDPLIISDPFTGIPIPFRVEYQVDSAGPDGKVDVPADAFLWNAQAGEFSSVSAGTQAISKVTFDFSSYFSSNWHHGQPITMADVIYSIFQTFDMVYNEDKANIEFAIATTSKPQLELYRGFRIVDENTLEVYIDFWHFVDDYIASYAVPASLSMPWEILAAMDEVVFKDRQAYYTDTAAQRFSADWLSLVNDGHARLVKNALRDFRDGSTLPLAALTIDSVPLVTTAEAMARYQAAIDWFDQYGLMVISNGPYILVDFDSASQFAELQAFRDPSYPFQPGDWYYGASPAIEISSVNTGTVSPGNTASITVAVDGPGVLGVDYLLFDPAAGAVMTYSAATRTTAGTFTISLSAQATQGMLTGDLYYLYITAYSDSISSLAERRADIVVGAAPSNGTEPPPSDNGTTAPPSSSDDSGGLSPIVIILPIAILAAGGIAYFVVRGGRAKETG